MLRKLKIKFVCINMVIVTVLMCVIMAFVVDSTRAEFVEQSMRTLEGLSMAPPKPHGGYELPPGTVRMPSLILNMAEDGSISARGDSMYDMEDEEFIRAIYQEAAQSKERIGVLEEYGLRYRRSNVNAGRIAFVDIGSERSMLRELYKNCVIIGSFSFLAFLAVSIFLANWAVRPVDKAWKEQRQFVADASHELKTPLTVITASAELLEQEAQGSVTANHSENILVMAKKMRLLVERLLDLARADNGQTELNFERLDMSKLCLDALLPFEPLFFEKGLMLDSQLEENVFVRGSALHLRQLADILLDNARKHSLSPGTVELKLMRQGASCMLTLENPCEEISHEDRKNIFKRFYRLDKARSADGSYGLGLSIAESIVGQHKGRIRCDWEKGRVRFTVTLPAVQ